MKLYKDFKSKKDQDNSFEIPEMFLDKYEIFNNLDSDDNLSWDSFATEYKEKDFNDLKIESSESSESDSESESEIEETSDYNNSSDTCGEDIIEVFSSDGSN